MVGLAKPDILQRIGDKVAAAKNLVPARIKPPEKPSSQYKINIITHDPDWKKTEESLPGKDSLSGTFHSAIERAMAKNFESDGKDNRWADISITDSHGNHVVSARQHNQVYEGKNGWQIDFDTDWYLCPDGSKREHEVAPGTANTVTVKEKWGVRRVDASDNMRYNINWDRINIEHHLSGNQNDVYNFKKAMETDYFQEEKTKQRFGGFGNARTRGMLIGNRGIHDAIMEQPKYSQHGKGIESRYDLSLNVKSLQVSRQFDTVLRLAK